MKPEIKIDIKSAEWKTRAEADKQIELLRQLIVNLKGEGVDMDFSAVEEAKKAREVIFPENERNNHE